MRATLSSLSHAPAALNDVVEKLRLGLSDRPVQRVLGAAGIVLFLLGVGVAIVSGDLKVVAILLLLLAAPFLIALAGARPYLFPYGLYIVLVPFDNLLSIGNGSTLTKLIGALTIAAVLFSILRARRIVRPPLAVVFVMLYTFWMLLTMFWAVDAGGAWEDVKTMFNLLLLYAVLASAPIDERDLRAICTLVVISGVAAALYGIWYFHQYPPSDDGRLFLNVAGRQIDPNGFADSLLGPIALALVALMNARTIYAFLVSIAALAVLGEGVLITLSREAMLGCVVVALVAVMMSRRRLLALALLLPSFALVLLFVPAVGARLGSAISSGGAGRTSIWQVDLHAWLQHPIFGWGAGSAFQAYSSNLLSVAPHDFAGWDRPPHNIILNVLLNLGIVGLVFLAAGAVSMFRQLTRIPRGDRLYDLRIALTAALAGIAVTALFIDNSTEKYVWVVLCAIAQLRTVMRSRSAPAPQFTDP